MNMDLRNLPEPVDGGGPALVFTQSLIFKIAGAIALVSMGMYYLLRGKKEQKVRDMVLGAILILSALFLF